MTYNTIEEAQGVLTAYKALYQKIDEIISASPKSNPEHLLGYISDIQIGPVETFMLYHDYDGVYQARLPSKYLTMEQEDVIEDMQIREVQY